MIPAVEPGRIEDLPPNELREMLEWWRTERPAQEQRLATLGQLLPRGTRRDMEDGHTHTFGLRRARVLVPKTVQPFDGSTAATATPTTTSALVGLVELQSPIIADRITYFGNGGGSNPAVVRLALYNEDGKRKLRDVTDAVNNAAAAERSVTFARIHLPPGNYYILACLSSGATSPPFVVYNTSTVFTTGASGEPDIEGNLTITGGAAPATFDPTVLSVAADRTAVFRLDGV